ncbi:hypothetical protein [Bacillus sp. REN16]|uniref:hypothetical protein n=1 Tax=Bacillus sp. REN16 TaxID=2887296 RepID=UPI001E3FD043|nr:hypothetical protein [Bacillus sp. REN16]MCC3358557.1 hypothetical protein [Bacillus sp. REN16]
MKKAFNFIQQKFPTSISGDECKKSIQFTGGSKPGLNKVKASGGCHDLLKVIFRGKLEKNRAQIRQGAFDLAEVSYFS